MKTVEQIDHLLSESLLLGQGSSDDLGGLTLSEADFKEFQTRLKVFDLPNPSQADVHFDQLLPQTFQIVDRDGIGLKLVRAALSNDLARVQTLVRLMARPSLIVADGNVEDPTSKIWTDILTEAQAHVDVGCKAVGRINLVNHGTHSWVGTGFLIPGNRIVTNRHVAIEFREDAHPWFAKRNLNNQEIKAYVDFNDDPDNLPGTQYALGKTLFIGPAMGPDLAIFDCEPVTGITPLDYAHSIYSSEPIAVIGYPWRDSRGLAGIEAILKEIFGTVFNVKRLAPGKLKHSQTDIFHHDCSTLRGNSGSPVISLASGKVLGVHYEGDLTYNSAVPVNILRNVLSAI